jgi:hypothetical protein
MISQDELTQDELRNKFRELQHQIVPNLTKKQRKEYQRLVRNIPNLKRKIKMINSFKEIAEKNATIKKKLKWIQHHFPSHIDKIKEQMKDAFPNQKILILESHIAKLKKVLPLKMKNSFISLKNRLRSLIPDDYDEVIRETRQYDDYEKKVRILKRKINKVLEFE